MTPSTKIVVEQLLVPATLRFFFIGGFFCLAIGLGLIISSERMYRFFALMNRWVSFRQSAKPLSVPRDLSSILRQYRQWFAAIFIVGALFSLCSLFLRIDTTVVASIFAKKMTVPHSFILWIVNSVWLFLVIGNLLAIAIGVMLGFFPNAAFALEAGSTRWYSFRGVSKGSDQMHLSLDNLVARSPRVIGWVIVAVALVELIDIGLLLFK